jgi:dethiobiotin synthetase
MMGLFFTGTDTAVGKTFITANVARLLRRQGCSVQVCKPVATGANWVDGRWLSDDTVCLADAAGMSGAWDEVTPWSFPEPAAPPVAARLQGVTLTLAEMVEAVSARSRPNGMLLVEGVGGLLCPLTEHELVADLAAALALPLIVVARRSLGTLNHTLLTLDSARQRGLAVAGVIVNETELPQGIAAQTNVEELRRRIDVPVLAVVPYQTRIAPDDVPALAAIDWRDLAAGRGPPR